MLTEIIATGLQLGDVEVAGAFGQPRHEIVAVAQLMVGEQPRNDLARRVVATAHTAAVQSPGRADHPIAPDHLQIQQK